MNAGHHLSLEDLLSEAHALLLYDPGTGVFTWKVDRGRNKTKGKRAGGLGNHGYWQINLWGRLALAHRLAWAMHHWEDPGDLQIDHINRVRTDNRIVNLRLVERSANQRNRGLQKNNTSGFTGVCWNHRRNAWEAKVTLGGKLNHLGYYSTPEAAASSLTNFKRNHP